MIEQTGRWKVSSKQSLWIMLKVILQNGRYSERYGHKFWTISQYFDWCWKAFWRKWLKGPLRCKMGTHRIGPESDTGASVRGGGDGCMDVWCLDCDRALRVPIDDVISKPEAKMVLDIVRNQQIEGGIT